MWSRSRYEGLSIDVVALGSVQIAFAELIPSLLRAPWLMIQCENHETAYIAI